MKKPTKFDFDSYSEECMVVIILKDYLKNFTNEYGIISIFDSVPDLVYKHLACLMKHVIEDGSITARGLANQILIHNFEFSDKAEYLNE